MYDKHYTPKYSRMLVKGIHIDAAEAFITLVRTSASFDKNSQMFTFLSNYTQKHYRMTLSELHSKLKQDGFVLDLHYLDNYRFTAIGGVLKGICQFDGTVEADFNVGKNASFESLLEEWQLIATACPWLDLTASFFSQEGCQGLGYPLFSFRVKEGKVTETNKHLEQVVYKHITYPELNLVQLDNLFRLVENKFYGLFTPTYKENLARKKQMASCYLL